ncbi:uncharacterized protein [Spinacia oleracea]|uniref:Uncharacterized protein n=1 Tax=Spinacia oleracea TaxID=3562 RepID=A0ABM3RRH1_SPIOL|nr:uncharacterized protein LOC130471885 [Spinacia oleracea]
MEADGEPFRTFWSLAELQKAFAAIRADEEAIEIWLQTDFEENRDQTPAMEDDTHASVTVIVDAIRGAGVSAQQRVRLFLLALDPGSPGTELDRDLEFLRRRNRDKEPGADGKIWRAWCLTVHSISQDCGAIALNYETGLSFLKASTNGLFIACFVSLALLVGLPRYGVYVAFSPVSDNVATASADRTAKLWNTDGTLLRTFEGHLDRLARISFHPSGKYLGTTSFDKTWRLWDIESGAELLLQEGHSRSVYAISFHPDGSLLASCGLDSLTRVWDLRTGRSILALEGHIKPVNFFSCH